MKKWHLWLAASIGLVVIAGMMIREFDVEALSRIDLSPRFFLGVVMGVLLFAVQNLMLTLRFRHLCQRKLSIAQGFRINVLCEFTSAVTPSAVGGSGLAFVYLNREGISMGRSIFTMFAALLADEAFLAISCLLLYFCVPSLCFSVWQMRWEFLRMQRTNGSRAECRSSSSSAPLSWLFGPPFSTSCYCIALRFWAGY